MILLSISNITTIKCKLNFSIFSALQTGSLRSPFLRSWSSRWDPACWPGQRRWRWFRCCLPIPPASRPAGERAARCGMSSRCSGGSPVGHRDRRQQRKLGQTAVCAQPHIYYDGRVGIDDYSCTDRYSVPLLTHRGGLVGVMRLYVSVCVLHIRAVNVNARGHSGRLWKATKGLLRFAMKHFPVSSRRPLSKKHRL